MSSAVISKYDQRREETYDERTTSKTFNLKILNNLLKRILIAESLVHLPAALYPSLVIVDMCGGKAGDLRKWIHTKRKLRYFIIDASPVELQRAERRFNELTNEEKECFESINFICGDAFSIASLENTIIKDIAKSADVISCQFAVHYAYETEIKSLQFWSVVDWLSHEGTVLALSHPMRQRIVEWCRAFSRKRKSINEDENSVCEISFVDPQLESLIAQSESIDSALLSVPQFGTCYRFSLDDALYQVPEFLLPCTRIVHQQAKQLANMKCESNFSVDNLKSLHSAEQTVAEVKNQKISQQEYIVACLYQYSLYRRLAEPIAPVEPEKKKKTKQEKVSVEPRKSSRVRPVQAKK